MTPLVEGGVIAAGQGSRLKTLHLAKPLARVAGLPLIERVLRNFQAAGIARASVIFNAEQEDCAAFVRERFPDLVPTILVRTTPHSLASFQAILSASAPGRVLVTTVDTLCSTEDFVAFHGAAQAAAADETILAVTSLVADEKPLWVRYDGDGRVKTIGGTSGDGVTAGFYVLSERARSLQPPPELARLRDYLSWLVDRGEPVRAVPIGNAVDVDRLEDVELAERLFGTRARAAGGAA